MALAIIVELKILFEIASLAMFVWLISHERKILLNG
jgi:hypothetical protein